MDFKQLALVLIPLSSTYSAPAQTQLDSLTEQLMETLASSLEESQAGEYDLSEITDRLAGYLRQPLDLNQAGAADLKGLFILNELQISSLLEHIRQTGPLLDLLELQSVPHFDLPLVRQLLPFVTLGTRHGSGSLSPRDLLNQPEQELLLYYSRVLARQKGYAKGASLPGGPERIMLRYRFRQGKQFRLHLLAEKDPGEVFAENGKLRGFDFYSGNVLIQPAAGVLKKVVAGDYLLQFGQGLGLWNGFRLGKGPAALQIGRQSPGIKPHNSSGEGYFFRGVAGSLALGKIQVSPFFSIRKLDGTLSDFDDMPAVSAIRRTGLHRTAGELASRHSLKETLAGLHLGYQVSSQFSLGFTGHRVLLDKPLLAGDELYELHEFSGKNNQVLSIDYSLGKSNFYLFGEVARSSFPEWRGGPAGRGWAFIQGILFSPARRLNLAAAWRHYGTRFQPMYAAPFGESSNAAGEKGFYFGLESRMGRAWTLNAYADAFSWSWLRYHVDAPARGTELMAQLTFQPDKNLTLYGRYRVTGKPVNRQVPENKLREARQATHQTARIHAEYRFSRRLRLRVRVDKTRYRVRSLEKGSGFSLYQDVTWSPGKVSIQGRFTYFDTDNYDTRIYSYESSLRSGASLAFFYDKGFKTYLGVGWKPGDFLDFRLRGSLLSYADRDRIGSGHEEIAGKRKPDIRLQIRLSF